jgi:hypothetical protein
MPAHTAAAVLITSLESSLASRLRRETRRELDDGQSDEIATIWELCEDDREQKPRVRIAQMSRL